MHRIFISIALICSAVSGQSATNGKTIFEGKGGCTSCHRVGGSGARTGPNLTDIGGVRKPDQLEKSILEPDSEIATQNRSYRVVTRAGETVTGRLLNVDVFSVQILDSKERLRGFSKADLREWAFVEKSPMPSYKDKLSAQELADLVSYLLSLKGLEP